MRTLLNRLVMFTLAVALAAGLAVVPANRIARAQDAKIVCDADLILSLYTAEYNFGYAAMTDMMMADKSKSNMMMADTSKLDYGQFTPLFDSMMKMMDKNMAMPGMAMDDKMMKGMMDMMAMDDASMEKMMMDSMKDMDMSKMTKLAPLSVKDEPDTCKSLRAELGKFYTVLAYENMMMASAKK